MFQPVGRADMFPQQAVNESVSSSKEKQMGIFRSVMGLAKARATHGLLRRMLGGPLSTALMAAFVGKKAYDMYRGRQRRIQYR
jgi:hypothetical protein